MTEVRKIAKHSKSRSGCLKCKQRHLRCDEAIPDCLNCVKKGLVCSGYVSPVKWSKKHELLSVEARQNSKCNEPGLHEDGQPVFPSSSNAIGRVSDPSASNPSPNSDESSEVFITALSSMSDGMASPHHNEQLQLLSAGGSTDNLLRPNETSYFENDNPVTYLPDGFCEDPDYWPTNLNDGGSMRSDSFSGAYHVVPLGRSRSSSRGSGLRGSYVLPLFHTLSESDEFTNTEESNLDVEYRRGSAMSFGGHSMQISSIPRVVSDDISSNLFHYYFSRTCQINSGFDSAKNPFRTTVSKLLDESLLVRKCILSMTAAHMSSSKPRMTSTALRLQTEAISCLSDEVANLGVSSKDSILLGIILLGMSSSWHNPSALGMAHLKGARSLFRSWIQEIGIENDDNEVDELSRRRSFLTGAISYWEALASFMMDQRLDAREYLKPFCWTNPLKKIYPNPWTGISTPLYIWLAEVGSLIRQKQLAVKMHSLHQIQHDSGVLLSYLSEHAFALEASLLSYAQPSEEMIEDTEDSMTSKVDLENISEIYRLTALLELYRVFPTLIDKHTLAAYPEDQEVANLALHAQEDEFTADRSAFLFDICLAIVQLMRAISEDSGSLSLLLFPIICAGTGLQYQMAPKAVNPSHGPRWRSLGLQLAAIRQDAPTIDQWRSFVRNRIILFHRRVGLDPIKWAAKIVEQVWSRSDLEHAIHSNGPPKFIYWMDIMMELRLETIFG